MVLRPQIPAIARLDRFRADLGQAFNIQGGFPEYPVLTPEIVPTYDITRLLADDPESAEPDTGQAQAYGNLTDFQTFGAGLTGTSPRLISANATGGGKVRNALANATTLDVDGFPNGTIARSLSSPQNWTAGSGIGCNFDLDTHFKGLTRINYRFSFVCAGIQPVGIFIGRTSDGVDGNGDANLVGFGLMIDVTEIQPFLISAGQPRHIHTARGSLMVSGTVPGLAAQETVSLFAWNPGSTFSLYGALFSVHALNLANDPVAEPVFRFPNPAL